MAIGDNIPKIFGNLAETSMKSSGDFQYHIDLLNNLDADQEMALRNEALNPMGPPAPMSGPLIDQMMLMSGGDPMAATDMVIQDSIMGLAPDNTELNKNRIAAQSLYDQFPGTVDSELINTVATNMDINPSDLQLSYDNVDARVMFNTLGDIDITSGENLIQSIPGTPNDPPPMPRGPLPEEPPPFEPDSSDYNTSLFGFPLLSTNIESGIDPTYFPNKELLGSGLGALGKGIGRGLGKLFPGKPITPPPSAEQVEGFIDNWQDLSEPELEAAIEQRILQGYSPESIKSLEQGDVVIASGLAREKESIRNLYPTDLIGDDEVTISDMVAAPEVEEKPFQWRGRGRPESPFPEGMDASDLSDIGPQVSATYDTGALPATFTALDPKEQWAPYMQSVLPNYYAPGVQSAYSRGYQPFFGSYLLSPEIGQFPNFMNKYKPEQFPQFEWDAFQPQWNQVLNYAEGQQAGDVSTVENASGKLLDTNPKLFNALTGSDAGSNAVAIAMARYNEGNMPLPSYGNNLLQQSLTDMFNRQQREDLITGNTNTVANFLANLAEMNPERFGR